MPRPRKDQEGPSARERMEEAFWEALTEKPYAKITVGEIAQRAHVNKNAFYYHYDGLQALAEQALDHMLPREVARMLLMRGGLPEDMDDAQISALANEPNLKKRLDRALLVVGKHGSSELVSVLKNLVMQTWFDLFNVDGSRLSSEAMVVVRFTLGGLLEIISDEACHGNNANPIQAILGSGIAATASAKVVETLRAAASENPHGRPSRPQAENQ
ncbi:TetR/AcrR family transcriptional regulator [Gordonibacter sp. 28C]|uniref:TetR/AcrR family transcriptional regulator n=1 Tax=Gordonibacter sp. 28C TaxID=2078569 RepID=UPI000DF7C62C|nr:TetR/AcrR family transcriptional regulator [Gordonibacter sp. 28C]RDB63888.1 TetR/AcrR family transcriptional regulator [Gordonibacter sp. 28C]